MAAPPPAVLAAFGATGRAYPLTGGQGRTWRAGGVVLKPCGDPAEAAWRAATLAALPTGPAVRVARPVRAADGAWTVRGWEASHAVEGAADQRRLGDVLAAGAAFHALLADVARPVLPDNPWRYADRVAWGEEPGHLFPELAALRRPIGDRCQVVHGDLLGNVLFADGLPPAVIDFSPYWRPTGWAAAVAEVDARAWHGAAPAGTDPQLLLRALLFRLVAEHARGRPAPDAGYRPIIDGVVERVTGRGTP
jgi:uncharacterized protein (TIGR02569 family)